MWEIKEKLDEYLSSIVHETHGEQEERIRELIDFLKQRMPNW